MNERIQALEAEVAKMAVQIEEMVGLIVKLTDNQVRASENSKMTTDTLETVIKTMKVLLAK